MDLREIARDQRRRQALEALEFEREREVALRGALEQTAADLEGADIDEAAFAQMTAEEAEMVRNAIGEVGDFELTDDFGEEWISFESDEERRAEHAEEIVRLQGELADSRRRQGALERYLELL